MEKRERLTRYARVADAQGLLQIDNIVARDSETLAELAEKMVGSPATRTIVVLDDQGHLIGLIPLDQLVDDVFFYIVPEEYLPDKAGYDHMDKHAKDVSQTTARDIMHPPVWTAPQETIKEAYMKLRNARLTGLPVLEDGRLVGYVDVLELLVAWLRAGQR